MSLETKPGSLVQSVIDHVNVIELVRAVLWHQKGFLRNSAITDPTDTERVDMWRHKHQGDAAEALLIALTGDAEVATQLIEVANDLTRKAA